MRCKLFRLGVFGVLLFLLIPAVSMAQLRPGLYGYEESPAFALMRYRIGVLLQIQTLTMMVCSYSDDVDQNIAMSVYDEGSRVHRIRLRLNRRFRKAFQWEAQDGTAHTAIFSGRVRGGNRFSLRIVALSEYNDSERSVNCYGSKRYNMRRIG